MLKFTNGTVRTIVLAFILPGMCLPLFSQISPGDLAEVHAHLEGISNCTECHTIGAKVTNDKCLACHTELRVRIVQKKGYHASVKVRGRECTSCHSDHHGRTFEIVRFRTEEFDHALTGYPLNGAHAKRTCADCHKPAHIADEAIREKKFTYLGLTTRCLGCHRDYHQATLPPTCSDCHNEDSFRPATKFDHQRTPFPLTGRHQAVACTSCHTMTTRNGTVFQEFSGTRHQSCANCHADAHQGRFGQTCADCHSTESFHAIRGMSGFDHSRTGFPLENRHSGLTCSSCHKKNLTDPLAHEKCTDCHADYHRGDFVREGYVRTCADCHTTKGFQGSSFTFEEHNRSSFQLKGAHLATPCFVCHRKEDRWRFRGIGTACSDCHTDIHTPHISAEYYPASDCRSCHVESAWNQILFDHSVTLFPLTGAHRERSCRDCHFPKDEKGVEYQIFSELEPHCSGCHQDPHYGQFMEGGETDCLRCHDAFHWNIGFFDHNTRTGFKLEGRHAEIACADCHKLVQQGSDSYRLYNIGETACEHCH